MLCMTINTASSAPPLPEKWAEDKTSTPKFSREITT